MLGFSQEITLQEKINFQISFSCSNLPVGEDRNILKTLVLRLLFMRFFKPIPLSHPPILNNYDGT